jgi:hypothetical protein
MGAKYLSAWQPNSRKYFYEIHNPGVDADAKNLLTFPQKLN